MNVERIKNHVSDASDRLLQQYQGRPNVQALLAAFTQHVQQLEDALFGISDSLTLANAAGAQMDVVGALVGADRNGLTDEQYLALIKGTIAQNTGDATTESLLTVLRALFQTDDVFLKTANSLPLSARLPRATVSISVGRPKVPQNVLPIIEQQVSKSVAGGVGLAYISRFDEPTVFSTAGKQSWVSGLGDAYDPSVGGKLSSVLQLSYPS